MDLWTDEIEKSDAVINIAGENISGENLLQMRWASKRKKAILESRNNTGKALAEAILKATHKPEVFIQASAIGYYGPSGKHWISEKAGPGNDFLASICAAWENSSKSVEAVGIRRIILRTGLVFARGSKLLALLKLPFHFFAGGKIGDGKQFLSWIHIDDWVGAVMHLLNNPKAKGAYNITAPEPVSNQDFAQTLGKAMHRPSFFPVPGFILRLALGEAATLALDGQRVSPQKLIESGYKFQYPKLGPALQELLGGTKPS